MAGLFLDGGAVSQWHDLLKDAEHLCGQNLDEELGSYLVFLLMRFTRNTNITNQVVALEYLRAAEKLGQEKKETLCDVGDQCLLMSGLFPVRAERRRVKLSYYVNIGQSAYQCVADVSKRAFSDLYQHIARSFISMMETLQAIRSLGLDRPLLDPISAYALAQDTGSSYALSEHTRLHEKAHIVGDFWSANQPENPTTRGH